MIEKVMDCTFLSGIPYKNINIIVFWIRPCRSKFDDFFELKSYNWIHYWYVNSFNSLLCLSIMNDLRLKVNTDIVHRLRYQWNTRRLEIDENYWLKKNNIDCGTFVHIIVVIIITRFRNLHKIGCRWPRNAFIYFWLLGVLMYWSAAPLYALLVPYY